MKGVGATKRILHHLVAKDSTFHIPRTPQTLKILKRLEPKVLNFKVLNLGGQKW